MPLRQAASCFAAFVFAALFVAFSLAIVFSIGASLNWFATNLSFIFCIALVHAVVLGLPLFLLLRHWRWVNAFSSVGAGFLVGTTGIFFLTLGQFDSGSSSSVNNVPHVINGVLTAAGWVSYLKFLAFFGVLGAFAGFVFWCILKWSGGAVSAEKVPHTDGVKNTVGAGIAVAAVVAMAAVFAAPAATKDRTCHNIFRDTNTIGPAFTSIDLSIATDNWPKLVQLFREFAAANELSFRNSSRDEFGARRILDLSLCNEAGVNIEAKMERWSVGIGITVRRLRDSSDSARLAQELTEKLELLSPGSVTFRDIRGNTISTPR